MSALQPDSLKPDWLENPDILPYVCIRPENQIVVRGLRHQFQWFDQTPRIIDPNVLSNSDFTELQMKVDARMLGQDMSTPRWAFYDCGILPGLISGFVMKKDKLPKELQEVYGKNHHQEWVPLSLFIVIPAIGVGEWVAHNLCSLNNLLPANKRLKGLGFLSKAYGLWYANINHLYGVTQWDSYALKLHANFGDFQLITTYNLSHNFAHSVTYKCRVDPLAWIHFFERKGSNQAFDLRYQKTDLLLYPEKESSLKDMQNRLERGEGPFFLSGDEVLQKPLGEALTIFVPRF